MRSIKGRLFLGGTALAFIYSMAWVLLFNFNRDAKRDDAVAMYERLQPFMTVAEFLEVTKDEPIPNERRDIVTGKVPSSLPKGWTGCFWIRDGRFQYGMSFHNGIMVEKYLYELNTDGYPYFLQLANRFLGLPLAKTNLRWQR